MAREVIEVSDSSESEEIEHSTVSRDHLNGEAGHGMNRQSPADQSPERSIADERSMPFAGKYAALRIGTTISSTSEYDTPMSDQGGDIPQVDPSNKYKIEVFVPPPRRPWEYRVYPDVSVILKVIRENERDKELNYLVKFKNGRLLTLAFDHLVKLKGGSEALATYYEAPGNPGRSEGVDSEISLVGTSSRKLGTKKLQLANLVDTSAGDSSEEDELQGSRTTSNARPRRKGSLLSVRIPRRAPSYDGSESDESGADRGLTGRRLPARGSRRGQRVLPSTQPSYNDELPIDNESEDSFEHEKRYTRLGKRKRRGFDGMTSQPTRRSERSGRAEGSIYERREDDIPEIASKKPMIKAVGAKERFKHLSKNSQFRSLHLERCESCDDYGDSAEKGRLIYCQGCCFSYHQSCLGHRGSREHLVTKIEKEDFVLQCRRCIECASRKDATAPKQGTCQVCHQTGLSCAPFRARKTSKEEQREREDNEGGDPITAVSSERINNASNVLFRCVTCYRAWHMHHLPAKSDPGITITTDDDQIAKQRFNDYSGDWRCLECSTAPAKVEALICWKPINEGTYIAGQSAVEVSEDKKEYLVKWEAMSYYKATWRPGPWVWGVTSPTMRKGFAARNDGNNLPKMRLVDAVPEEYLRIDIVFAVEYNNIVTTRLREVDKARVKEVSKALVKFKGLGYDDAVWDEPPDIQHNERWDDFRIAYEDWVDGHYIRVPAADKLRAYLKKARAQNFEERIMLKEQPKSLTGGKLMGYQMEGLNWLLYQWHQGANAVLADEMGTGKTIQVIAFLATLHQVHKCWPFLIVVPDSTVANWKNEMKQWAPSLRLVTYFGSAKARELATKYEMFPEKSKDLSCHVVVTSYNAAQDPESNKILRKIPWAGLIVDEGHRLKNEDSLLYKVLRGMNIPFRLLMTGTPLQNNQRELYNLIQFLDPTKNAEALEEQYAELTKENLPELHQMLRPFFLRRTKKEVLKFLPPVAHVIVPVVLSSLQKQLYKSVLAKNAKLLEVIFGGDKKMSTKVAGVHNVLMQLRKCLCHPFVYSINIEEQTSDIAMSHRSLVEASSKLQLLDIMLPKLKALGHRVLIFSQFLDMLTIMEDFLDGLGMLHTRIDGSMGSMDKQKCIDAYNEPESPIFAFLLSTRAGGVGINLATADTVIILDPDFNPQQDIQALSRAHRIGQKKKVLVFQLMTRGTAEEKIMQLGKKKMALDHVLIDQMDADELETNDLESVLRFGAEAIFKDDDSEQDIHYNSASVDKLLDRSHIEDANTGDDNSTESQFSFARVWANDKGTLEEDLAVQSDSETQVSPDLWVKIIEERSRQVEEAERGRQETFGRGKRQRRVVNYKKQTEEFDSPEKIKRPRAADVESDNDYQSEGAAKTPNEEENEPAAIEETEELRELLPKAPRPPRQPKVFKRATMPPSSPVESRNPLSASTAGSAPVPCIACKATHPVGYCPVKFAGVESCPLCGLAHYGIGRTCPNLQDEIQCREMIKLIKESNEPKHIKEKASPYVRGVLGDIIRKQKAKGQEQSNANPTNGIGGPSITQPRHTVPPGDPRLATFATRPSHQSPLIQSSTLPLRHSTSSQNSPSPAIPLPRFSIPPGQIGLQRGTFPSPKSERPRPQSHKHEKQIPGAFSQYAHGQPSGLSVPSQPTRYTAEGMPVSNVPGPRTEDDATTIARWKKVEKEKQRGTGGIRLE